MKATRVKFGWWIWCDVWQVGTFRAEWSHGEYSYSRSTQWVDENGRFDCDMAGPRDEAVFRAMGERPYYEKLRRRLWGR